LDIETFIENRIVDGINICAWCGKIPRVSDIKIDMDIIIEYHGNTFHYNKDIHDINDCNPFGKRYSEIKEKDDYKRELAVKNGFKIFEVFSSDNFNENINKIIKYTNDRRKKIK